MHKRILIITNSGDLHADLVEPILIRKGSRPFRLDLDKFPRDYVISHEIIGQKWSAKITHLGENESIELNNVGAVWTRKPADFSFFSDDLPPQEAAHAKQETEQLLNGLLYTMDCYWMNHPLSSRSALWKTEQSIRAARMGFNIPPALATNQPEKVCAFRQQTDKDIVLKSLSSPFLGADKVSFEERSLERGLRTTIVTSEHMENIDAVKQIPCYFQHYFEKAFELRVTVIGQKVFAAKIHSQDSDSTKIDFRDFDADILYEAYTLPAEIERQCREFVHSYNLQYGAMDIIVTPSNDYVFLENNPAGQFLFVQQRVPQLAMLEALADCLIEGATCHK